MRKLQVNLTEDCWRLLESLTKEANQDFQLGTITLSDVVSEMISTAKIDLRALQAKHTNIRKSLRLLASRKDIDLDAAIQQLMELKGKSAKKIQRTISSREAEIDGHS